MTLLTLLLLGVKIVSVAKVARSVDVGRDFTDFDVELDVDVALLADHDAVFEMEVEDHYHFFVAGLEDRVFDIHVQNINPVIEQLTC